METKEVCRMERGGGGNQFFDHVAQCLEYP